MNRRQGRQTLLFPTGPRVAGYASVVGQKEAQGPLGHTFDESFIDDYLGKESWEKAETAMLERTVDLALSKAGLFAGDADAMLAGDLLNQIVTAGYAARGLGIPFFGLYGACSTMAESLLLGAALIDGGYAKSAVCAASSHFATAERQYRFPLEMGAQRPPTAQWTVTGAGATVLRAGEGLKIAVRCATVGRVADAGQKDLNNMGAAMAPAAADTLLTHLRDTGRGPDDYDLIATGDLGHIGEQLMRELCRKEGLKLDHRYIDCGSEIYQSKQDVHAGGSGCGCSAVCLNGWLLQRMLSGEIGRMLLIATGAMMSPTTSAQGESIPAIAHAVCLEVM